MLGIFFSQSFDIIDRGIGTKEDLNFGCQIALGFRKGPLDVMRDLGESEIDRIMGKFEEDRPGFPKPKSSFDFYQSFRRYLLVDELDGVKIITLRRPQAMNALNDEITQEILSALQEYENDPSVKGFVITGYGNSAFSAGAEIGKFPQMLGDKEASIRYSKDLARVQLFMDRMEKPIVAAINGLALGGGLEVAIRCHEMVATANSTFQFPEINLGILPAIGGCVVPYRKWPQGAKVFHEMLLLGKPVTGKEAFEIGMVSAISGGYADLIRDAVNRVLALQRKIKRIPEGRMEIPEIVIPEKPMSGKLPLSKEAVSIVAETIRKAAAATSLSDALEVGYEGFGDIACTDAAKEGISAFMQKRKPQFSK
jgi:enoyl-CoA hydratase / 3-hydroxyacyl-CoA dehydrogenase